MKNSKGIPVLRHTFYFPDALIQFQLAEKLERDYNIQLVAEGWQLHPDGYFWHFWRPGMVIHPG